MILIKFRSLMNEFVSLKSRVTRIRRTSTENSYLRLPDKRFSRFSQH